MGCWRYLSLLAVAAVAVADPAPKRVLLLQYQVADSAALEIVQAAESVLRQRLGLGAELLPESAPGKADARWLANKYERTPIDVLMVASSDQLETALEFRRITGTQAPMVLAYGSGDAALVPAEIPRTVRLVFETDWLKSLQTAFALLPDTRAIAIVGGASPSDLEVSRRRITRVRADWPGIPIIELFGMNLPQILAGASSLPPSTLIMLSALDLDLEGKMLSRPAVSELLAQQANAPHFDNWSMTLGHGQVGGWVVSPAHQGRRMAELAVDLLQGASPESLGTIRFAPASYRFDQRQLRRWNINESRLPAGSSIEFREPGFWERYRDWIFLGAGIAASLIGLLFYLLVERHRRVRSHQQLQQRAGLEAILSRTLRSFTQPAPAPEDSAIQQMLEGLRTHLEADVTALMITRTLGDRVLTQAFRSPPRPALTGPQDYPYLAAEIAAGRPVRCATLDELPAQAAQDRATLEQLGVTSFCAAPVSAPGGISGVIVVGQGRPREWDPDLTNQVRELGDAAVGAWGHQLAAGESLSETILGSFDGYVLALDGAGVVLHTNSAPWVNSGAAALRMAQRGQPYESIWSMLPGGPPAAVREAVEGVLSGARPEADEELRINTAGGDCWLQVHVQPLQHPDGGAVVTHLDITQRKRGELAGAQDMSRIAHVSRVSALGELATSLAHEVNQPLSAMVANAAVAQAMLARTQGSKPDLQEVQAVLADVQSDGQRAAAVIREMRGLLKRGDPVAPPTTLDLSEVARDTIRLVVNDASRRGVRLEQQWHAQGPVPATIGRTPLQQVILNLLNNALDAAAAAPEGQRWVRVCTTHSATEAVLTVDDSGPGIPPADRERIFQPFMTTKEDGIGVGLAISRSIATAAQATLTAEAAPGGGARFLLRFPAPLR